MFCVVRNKRKPSSHALSKNHPQHPLKIESKEQAAAKAKRRPHKRKHDGLQPLEGEPKKGKVEEEKEKHEIFAKTKREGASENWKTFVAVSKLLKPLKKLLSNLAPLF